MKKQNIGLYVLGIFVIGLAVTVGVKAFSGNAGTEMENVNIENYNVEAPVIRESEELGAITGPDVYYDMTFHKTVKFGKVKQDWLHVNFTDATTTIAQVVNPEGAKIFVDDFYLIVDGVATTSAYVTCGTSTTAYRTADPTDLLLDDVTIATSTLMVARNRV